MKFCLSAIKLKLQNCCVWNLYSLCIINARVNWPCLQSKALIVLTYVEQTAVSIQEAACFPCTVCSTTDSLIQLVHLSLGTCSSIILDLPPISCWNSKTTVNWLIHIAAGWLCRTFRKQWLEWFQIEAMSPCHCTIRVKNLCSGTKFLFLSKSGLNFPNIKVVNASFSLIIWGCIHSVSHTVNPSLPLTLNLLMELAHTCLNPGQSEAVSYLSLSLIGLENKMV